MPTEISESKLNGNWILTDYLDSILTDQTIAKHTRYLIAYEALYLKIEHDTLRSTGLLFNGDSCRINQTIDSIGILKSYYIEYQLVYDKTSDCIRAIAIPSKENNPFLNKIFTYRRVTENRLAGLDVYNPFLIRKKFHQLFIDSLIAGEYKSLEDGSIMKLLPDGTMCGFKKYNEFDIHDFFGTLHPFEDYDEITFMDTNYIGTNVWPHPIEKSRYFNWVFKQNKLTLTELISDPSNNNDFIIGHKKYHFIRQANRK